MHIIPQYLGRVEGKQFKLYLSLTRLNVQVPFFYGRVTSAESAESASFESWVLSRTKDSFCGRGTSWCLAVNRRLSPPTSVPKTEDSFPNFSNEENGILAKRVNGPIIWLFPSPSISSGHDTRVTWIPFFVQQTAGNRVREVDFYSYLLLTASLSACWFRHRRVGESTSPSLSL